MASRGLGSLTLDLLVRLGSFEQGMDKAARTTEQKMKIIEGRAKAAGVAIGAALAAGATAAATAAIALTKSAIDNADALRDLSIRTGVAVEQLSAYSYAASQTGTDIDTLAKGLKTLSKTMTAALDEGSKEFKLFDALNIAVDDGKGGLRELDQILPQIADKFKLLEDGPTKAALALQLFGKAGVDLTEFLNSGSDGLKQFEDRARELGIEISSNTAAAADEFNDKLADLKAVAGGLGVQLASNLLPQLNELLDRLVEITKDGSAAATAARNLGAAMDVLGGFAGFVGTKLQAIEDFAESAATAFYGLQTAISGVLSLDFSKLQQAGQLFEMSRSALGRGIVNGTSLTGPASAPRGVFAGVRSTSSTISGADQQALDRSAARQAELEAALAAFNENRNKPKSGGGSKAKSGPSDAEREAQQLLDTYNRLIAGQKESIALFGQTSEAAKIRYDVENGELAKLDATQKAALITGAERQDQLRIESDLQKELADAEKKKFEAAQEAASRTSDFIKDQEFELKLLGLSNLEREKEIALRYANVTAMSAEGQQIIDNVDKRERAIEQQQFAEDVQRGLTDAIVDYAIGAKSAKEAFGDFADQLFKRALEFVADKAIQALFDSFSGTNQQGGGGGQQGGGWAGLFASFLGSYGGGRANGGPVMAGSFYEVGERNQPELLKVRGRQYMIPGDNGAVMPMRGGGGVQQVNNFQFAAPTDPRTQNQIAARMAYETNRAATRNR